jgi:hypothetical protein
VGLPFRLFESRSLTDVQAQISEFTRPAIRIFTGGELRPPFEAFLVVYVDYSFGFQRSNRLGGAAWEGISALSKSESN